jgi:hypothetical protein
MFENSLSKEKKQKNNNLLQVRLILFAIGLLNKVVDIIVFYQQHYIITIIKKVIIRSYDLFLTKFTFYLSPTISVIPRDIIPPPRILSIMTSPVVNIHCSPELSICKAFVSGYNSGHGFIISCAIHFTSSFISFEDNDKIFESSVSL